MKYALISTFDKTGLEPLVRELSVVGYRILSTGGTAKYLRNIGFQIIDVSEYTGTPEVLGGRVKTLNPKIFAGILSRRENIDDAADLEKIESYPIDIVVCNLYPFEETTAKPDCTLESAVEQIDIGGVTLLRAAAKNFKDVFVLSSSDQYQEFIERISNGRFDKDYRKKLAVKAFKKTMSYDTAISGYLSGESDTGSKTSELLDETIKPTTIQELRYGENPHQKANLYSFGMNDVPINLLQGKKLSYNNILDADAALETILEFDKPAAVIMKHLTPTGIAISSNIKDAYLKAFECDKVSPYGGIFAFNREVDPETAKEVSKLFAEIILAPSFSDGAMDVFAKKKNLRLLTFDPKISTTKVRLRGTAFGVLAQEADKSLFSEMKIAGTATVSEVDMEELAFGMLAVKHVKSNAIVLTKGFATIGVGAGQPNRVASANIAANQAGEKAIGSYLASDAFIPFADTVETAKKAGIKAIIEPGGSIRDQEVIDKANELGIGLVFTGQRHFLH